MSKTDPKRQLYRMAGGGVAAMVLLTALSCFAIRSYRLPTETNELKGASAEENQTESTASFEADAGMNILIGKAPATKKKAALTEEQLRLGPLEGDSFYMDSSMGLMMYFSQKDPRWKDYLWGGEDAMRVYGCGPTSMAMVANAFGSEGAVIPVTMAEWCDANGQRGAHAGSNHSIVHEALTEFGLNVTSMQGHLTEDAVREALSSEQVLVALVGPGYFTDGGHFIVIRGLNADGTVSIADPASVEHTKQPYEISFILGELKTSASDAGGPLWSVSRR